MKNNTALGQHWLKDRALLDQIADYAAAQSAPLCLEIGPGLGTLTSSLLRRFPQVIAVELDERLAANLGRSFPGKNLLVKNQDFLQLDLSQFNNQDYVVAGNIPYYITTPILKHLLAAPHLPKRIVLLVQKELLLLKADTVFAMKPSAVAKVSVDAPLYSGKILVLAVSGKA